MGRASASRLFTHSGRDRPMPVPFDQQLKLERIDFASLVTLAEDIRNAKALADFVIVALSQGIGTSRAGLASYERPLAHAAVEAGCDVVIGHHAHIVPRNRVSSRGAHFPRLGEWLRRHRA